MTIRNLLIKGVDIDEPIRFHSVVVDKMGEPIETDNKPMIEEYIDNKIGFYQIDAVYCMEDKDDDSKTITFTKEELEVLKEYLFCNPCSGGCVCEVSDKVDCYDLKKNGEYKCKFKQLTRQIEKKILGDD